MSENQEIYQTKMDEFMRRIPDNIYIFEVTKLCGYGEFIMVYKNASIYDLFTPFNL